MEEGWVMGGLAAGEQGVQVGIPVCELSHVLFTVPAYIIIITASTETVGYLGYSI